jgi:hypothetical protein
MDDNSVILHVSILSQADRAVAAPKFHLETWPLLGRKRSRPTHRSPPPPPAASL